MPSNFVVKKSPIHLRIELFRLQINIPQKNNTDSNFNVHYLHENTTNHLEIKKLFGQYKQTVKEAFTVNIHIIQFFNPGY